MLLSNPYTFSNLSDNTIQSLRSLDGLGTTTDEYLRFLSLCGRQYRRRNADKSYPPSSMIYRIWEMHATSDPSGYRQCCIEIGADDLPFTPMEPSRDYIEFLVDMERYSQLLLQYSRVFGPYRNKNCWEPLLTCVLWRDWET